MARTNEELNKAIWTVLTTQFKKEAKEAFKTVQDNGYEVHKNGCGTWSVGNPHTRKFIHIEYGNYRTRLYYGNYTTQCKTWKTPEQQRVVAEKFDFVNCLRTPQNNAYYEAVNGQYEESKAKQKYHELKSVKWSLNYENQRIAKIQADIAKLQAELISATESKVKDEMRLQNKRKELGLVK